MFDILKKAAKWTSETVYKKFSKHTGEMLLTTSILGIFASCVAQMGVIMFNKKYTREQKSFMLPQEGMEGVLSALSIFFVTRPTQKFALRSIKSGKILTSELRGYLEKNNLIANRGKKDFNIKKSIENIIGEIEKSDKFIKSSEIEKQNLLTEHKNALHSYNCFEDSAMAIATTGAVAFSTAAIIPPVRNKVASYCQKNIINKNNSKESKCNKTNHCTYYNKLLFNTPSV